MGKISGAFWPSRGFIFDWFRGRGNFWSILICPRLQFCLSSGSLLVEEIVRDYFILYKKPIALTKGWCSKRQLLESLYGGQFTLSTPLIKPNFCTLDAWWWAMQGVCTVYSITREEETRKATNPVSQLHSTHRHRQHGWPGQAVWIGTGPLWLEEACSRLLCSRQMMMMMMMMILLPHRHSTTVSLETTPFITFILANYVSVKQRKQSRKRFWSKVLLILEP